MDQTPASFYAKAAPLAKRKSSHSRSAGPTSGLGVRRSSDGRGWVFVHPRCARDRAEDLDDVRAMIEAGELDVAIDELRWLLGGCSEFIEAHTLLGELALAAGEDIPLARGHFGFAVQLGLKSLKQAGVSGSVPYQQPANRPFYVAGRGLVWCLAKLDMLPKAQELVESLVKLDPTDPLELRKLLDEIRSGGLPIVELTRDADRDEDSSTLGGTP